MILLILIRFPNCDKCFTFGLSVQQQKDRWNRKVFSWHRNECTQMTLKRHCQSVHSRSLRRQPVMLCCR